MRIDGRRFFLILLVCILGQYVIKLGVVALFSMMGWTNYLVMLFVIDVLIGFFFAYLYFPSEYRQGIFKNPDYYKNAGIFAIVIIIIDAIRYLL